MHAEVKRFIKDVRLLKTKYFFFKKVLESGSLNINGSTRDYFYFCHYFGIDIGSGKGVDMICPARFFKNKNYYDVVISTEQLEHDNTWQESLWQLYENLKSGGLMLITCAAPNRPEHGTKRTTPQDSPYTQEYYKNISIPQFIDTLPRELFSEYNLNYERNAQDLYFFGIKK